MNQNKISLIFIGTAAIGAPLLEALAKDDRFEVKLVVTQIDKPAGRKMQLTPPPVKLAAVDLGLPLFQPDNINEAKNLEKIEKMGADMIVLMAYGQILKQELLDIPKHGCINVHASLLPKHRGASPIQQSLLHMHEKTGISIMQMVQRMDAGPVYDEYEMPIDDDENAESLLEKLACLTAEHTPDVLEQIVEGELEAREQDHSSATYCQKIHKADGHIDWNEHADQIVAKVRAFTGWPGTHTFWDGRRLKILTAKEYEYDGREKPGTVFQQGNAVLVMAGRDAVLLEEVQLEGKNPQNVNDLVRGHTEFVGADLSSN